MIEEFIKFVPLFAGLSEHERAELTASFVEGQCATNASLLTAGAKGEALYLIGQGFVGLSTQSGQSLATLGPGSILGEASLFRNSKLDVSAVALSDLAFWKLSDRSLRDLILANPSIGLKLSQNFGSLLAQMADHLMRRLGETSELGNLPPNTLQALAANLVAHPISGGETLYHAGEKAIGLMLLEEGAIDLQPEKGAEIAKETRVRPGAMLGVLALLTGKPYQHTAVAADDSLLWMLPTAQFQTVSTQHPGLRRGLARTARTRLSRTDQSEAVRRLAQMPIFTEVAPQTMQAIAESMVLQHVPAGERVYMMGEAGDALYLIDTGEIELTAENASGVVEELARVGDNGFFGEMSLLTGQIRTEDSTAIRNTNLWILYKAELDELANRYPEIGKALSQGLASRLAADDEEEYEEERFRKFQLFSELDVDELRQVVERLKPMRYRATEQIFRSTSPADTLFLLESGQVRIQPLSNGSWLLGPGEAFGERALLTNQPHNASAVAETDVDVWTLSKSDFDNLMTQYPSLAINMSRILSLRMAQMDIGDVGESIAGSGAAYTPANAVSGGNVPARRRRSANYDRQESRAERPRFSFGQWFSDLTPFGKIRLAVLVLLLIWLLGIAAPAALLSLIQGTSVASGADLTAERTNLLNAISAVYAVGSYELAAKDGKLAMALSLADKRVPATPTYTPPPTNTPIPTMTPLPTKTPLPSATPTNTAVPVQYVQQFVAPAAPAPEPTAVVAAAPARIWDSRLDRLGVRVDPANVAPGQQYWRLVEAQWWDETQSGGKHHIYVEVLDENGNRLVGHPVTVYWGDGNHTGPTEDKAPPDYGFNYQMYAAGNAYNVKVEGLPSDVLVGAGMGDIERPAYGIHTAFLLTYQKSTK